MKKLFNKNLDKDAQIFFLFVAFQVFNLLIIKFSGKFLISSNNFLFNSNSTNFKFFGNFDGEHYFNIATSGYALYEQAFFPLYPLLMRIFSFGDYSFTSGILISNISFILFLVIFYKILIEELDSKKAVYTILFLVFFPTSFYFVSLYTEGLFSLLFILTIYFLRSNKFFYVIITAYLAALTKLVGVFLIIPIFIYLIFKYREKINIKMVLALLAPVLGFLTYCLYLFKVYGDFLLFLHVQPGFGANRSSNIILFPQVIYRYIKIFTTADWNYVFFISVIEFSTIILFLIVLTWQLYYLYKYRRKNIKGYVFLLAINLFSIANLLIPTMSGTFSSVPRYILMSLGFFIALSFIKNDIVKLMIIIIFLIFHVILLAFFAQGYFVS